MPDAFDAQLLAALPKLRRYCAHLTRNRHAAEDLAQDVVMLALAARDSFTVGTQMQAWLSRIAFNRHVALLRRKHRSAQHLTPDDIAFDALPEFIEEPRQDAALELRDALRTLGVDVGR